MRQFFTAICLVTGLLFFFAPRTDAHDEFRVIGTLTKHDGSIIEVKSRDGRTTSIAIDRQTVIKNQDKPADAASLTAGISVVVDALGDSVDDLLAIEVRIVPPIAAR